MQTYFFRRTSMTPSDPRWTDHLLWHHAARTGGPVRLPGQPHRPNQRHGPHAPGTWALPWTWAFASRRNGAICALRRFNNIEGRWAPSSRYIGGTATCIAATTTWSAAGRKKIDVSKAMSMNGIELQDRVLRRAIRRKAK